MNPTLTSEQRQWLSDRFMFLSDKQGLLLLGEDAADKSELSIIKQCQHFVSKELAKISKLEAAMTKWVAANASDTENVADHCDAAIDAVKKIHVLIGQYAEELNTIRKTSEKQKLDMDKEVWPSLKRLQEQKNAHKPLKNPSLPKPLLQAGSLVWSSYIRANNLSKRTLMMLVL